MKSYDYDKEDEMVVVNPHRQVVEALWSWCHQIGIPLEFVSWEGEGEDGEWSVGEGDADGFVYRQETDVGVIRLGFNQPVALVWVRLLAEVLSHLAVDRENQFVIASVVHEVRNPLTVALGYQELMSQSYSDPLLTKTAELLIQISDRLEDVLRGYQEILQFEAFDLARLCQDVGNEFQEFLRRKSVSLRITGDMGWIRGDRRTIRQVVRNLLRNACDAVNEGGEIDITTENQNTHVLLRVSDNGTGIAAGIRPFLFHPYYTSKSDGHGLGLVICRRIVEQHHGSIDIEDLSPGTAILVRLPKNPQKERASNSH